MAIGNLRTALNLGDPNRFTTFLNKLGGFGEFLNRLLFSGVAVPAVATANAATQTSSYVQADVQTIATLANSLKVSLNALITGLGNTESSVTVTASVAALANKPVALLNVVAVTVSSGSATGPKKIRLGATTGPSALVPAAGEVIWDGNKGILFAAADLVATASFTYTKSTDVTASALQQDSDG